MRPGSAVGQYVLHDEIASGGMGTVYIGHLRGSGGFSRVVAIKQLSPLLAKEPEFLAMFLDEARLAGRVRHPNVVATLDVVESDGEVFIVMEYVQGESLAQLVRLTAAQEQQIPPRIVSAIMSGVLYGLHAAHEAKTERGEPLCLVHRDVSPQNVIVGTDGVARVVDFGVAKAVGRLHTTSSGQLKGKLAYMAPEQLHGKRLDRTADIFSAGVVLWEALTGERLFRGENEPDTMTRVLAGQVPVPSTIVPKLPPSLDSLILRALSRVPADRFATAREMSVALIDACPPAAPHEVGEWVEACAHQSLLHRSARIAELESGASGVREARDPNEPASLEPTGDRPPSQVSSISVAVPGRAEPARHPAQIVVATLAVVLVVGAIVLGVLRWGPHDTAASAPAASASDTTLAPAVSRPPATPLPGPAPSADAPMTPPVASPPSPSSLPLPSVPARTSAPAQPPAGRSGGRPDCNPPYVRGPDGHKMWKRECLDNAP